MANKKPYFLLHNAALEQDVSATNGSAEAGVRELWSVQFQRGNMSTCRTALTDRGLVSWLLAFSYLLIATHCIRICCNFILCNLLFILYEILILPSGLTWYFNTFLSNHCTEYSLRCQGQPLTFDLSILNYFKPYFYASFSFFLSQIDVESFFLQLIYF